MHFGKIVPNQNKTNKIKTLHILEIRRTGCSTKEAMTVLLRGAPKNSRKSGFYTVTFSK